MNKARQRADAGAGSVTQRKNGLWEARWDKGWVNGKRVRVSFYGKTKKEARAKLDEAKANGSASLKAQGRKPTVAVWLENWLEQTARRRLRLSTYVRYSELIRRHIIPSIGRERLDKVTPETVQSMLNERQNSGLSPQTVHHLRAVLRTALKTAMKRRLVQYNAAELADSPDIPHREPVFLNAQQAQSFLEAAASDKLAALYTLCFATGLRQGEALALRWEDVDTQRGTVRVGHNLRRMRPAPDQPTKLFRTDTKTPASRRMLPLPPFVVTALQHHRERQMFEARAAEGRWQDSGYVFTNKLGGPLEAVHLSRSFKTFLEKAGLPEKRFHDLRHSAISLMLAAGVPPRTVMSYAGHSSLATTMNIYAHVNPQMLGQAADTMQRQLAGTSS